MTAMQAATQRVHTRAAARSPLAVQPFRAPMNHARAATSCPCGGPCPRCAAQSAPASRTSSRVAIQRDADPSPPPDFKEDSEETIVAGGDPGFDDGSAAEGSGGGAPPKGGTDEDEKPAAVQAASIAASPQPATTPVAADRVASGLGSGAALDPGLHDDMSAFFGQDIGSVRMHTDATAGSMAQSLHAHAFTVGDQIAFGHGRYQPEHPDGQRLLVHELTHVQQQRRGLDSEIRRAGIGTPGDRYEAEAERNAERFARGEKAESIGDAGGSAPHSDGALQLYAGGTASTYARTWAKSTNPAYPRDGNDCTNFVSQAVLAGGWTMVGGSCGDRKDDTAWWYGNWTCAEPGVHRSYTWGGAQNFFNFVSGSGRGTAASKISDLDVGDVLQVAHSGVVGHTTMVTGKPTGNLVLSYHTTDTLDLPVWGKGGFLSKYAGMSGTTYLAWKL